mmetsp:Transcript_6416/g.9541  ORF Transcript_6416/g.9541 Transcript_6416/m.9541 type:complete len:216 (-) Transcript_6416:153-800(-)
MPKLYIIVASARRVFSSTSIPGVGSLKGPGRCFLRNSLPFWCSEISKKHLTMCLKSRCEGVSCMFSTMLFSTLQIVCRRSKVTHKYPSPFSSVKIFCMIKVATVLDNSEPLSIIRKQSGMISVWMRKSITLVSSAFTRAPITPKEVSLRYSKGLEFERVFRKGYRNSGMWAFRNSVRVSGCEAIHCSKAKTLQTLLEATTLSVGGTSKGYTETIS